MDEEARKSIDWRKVSLKSFDSYFSKSVSQDDFRKYISEAYGIANGVRRKTLLRFAARMFFHSLAGAFKKLRR
jgi:hypothetical protein